MHKNWRGGVESLLKNGAMWLRLLNMLFLSRIYIARGPWYLGNFCNIFLPKISEDQKKPYHLSAGPRAVPYGKYGAGYCITFIKSLDEGLRLQFLGQKPLILLWL